MADGRDAAEIACSKLACAIQVCIQENNYKVTRSCKSIIDAHETCVKTTREKLGIADPRTISRGGAKKSIAR